MSNGLHKYQGQVWWLHHMEMLVICMKNTWYILQKGSCPGLVNIRLIMSNGLHKYQGQVWWWHHMEMQFICMKDTWYIFQKGSFPGLIARWNIWSNDKTGHANDIVSPIHDKWTWQFGEQMSQSAFFGTSETILTIGHMHKKKIELCCFRKGKHNDSR